jgi:hypothetical protein
LRLAPIDSEPPEIDEIAPRHHFIKSLAKPKLASEQQVP